MHGSLSGGRRGMDLMHSDGVGQGMHQKHRLRDTASGTRHATTSLSSRQIMLAWDADADISMSLHISFLSRCGGARVL